MLKHRSQKYFVAGLMVAMLIAGGLLVSRFMRRAIAAPIGVIVELKSDPVIVAKTKAEASGQSFDPAAYGVSSPATFDYTAQVGADQQLSPGESTASRRLQFNDPASEMFTFTVAVRGYFPDAAGGTSGSGAASTGDAGSSSSGSSAGSGLSLPTRVMQVTVNPLTKSVTTRLL